jgi:prolipoprotein diacylglyceryltransferase
MGLNELLFIPLLLAFLAGFAFWIWMLVDCATHEPSVGNDKIVWIIIIVFTQIIGAILYYFIRHTKRAEQEWIRGQRSTIGLPD